MGALNNVQLEILKLFHEDQSEEELLEIKQVLTRYLANKLMSEVDKIAEEKGYTPEIIETWKDEHFRTPYSRK